MNAVRSLIMLSCLVALPLVAIVWKDLPDWCDRARALVLQAIDRKPGAQSPTEAPPVATPLVPMDPALRAETAAWSASPAAAAPEAWPTQATPARLASSTHGVQQALPEPPAAWAAPPVRRQSASDWSRRGAAAPPASQSSAPVDPQTRTLAPLVPIARSAPTAPEATLVSHQQPGAVPAESTPTMEQLLARLRQLGATYYLLETWGSDARLFRFHANMSLAGRGSATRHFEATAPDPLAAVVRVVQQVQTWRGLPEQIPATSADQ